MQRKKILIFTPGGVGGAERMSVLIGKMLPKERYKVKFVVIGRLRNIYNIIPEDYEVDCIPVRNIYEFSMLRIWWKIIREKPDVVFTSQVAYNPRVILAARLAGRKVVARSSGMLGNYPSKKLRSVQRTYPKADKLIAQQEDMRQEMLQLLEVSPEKIVTIHNPIDLEQINGLSNAPSPFPDDASVNFVEAASVNHRKAQDVAIKAFALVKKEIPAAQLYFVGGYDENSDYYRSLLADVDKEGLEGSVHFVGYDKNPFRWVKNADCFVFPSRAEGLPNALVEASYLGVPCAAARCLEIVKDIIIDGQNGYTVPVDDVPSLAEAMLKAVKLTDCKMAYQPGKSEDFSQLFGSL